MNEITYATASDLVRMLAAGRISATELLDENLARVKKLNPAINAIVALDEEGARKAAKDADAARARGDSLGALHGVSMTIKDTFAVTGMPTTCGLEPLRDYRPTADAAAVANLRMAGAIIFGKTNLPPAAADHQSCNALFGLTRNPWNGERTVGGSSGGSAAALAAGFTPLELGSDIGGSIRCPRISAASMVTSRAMASCRLTGISRRCPAISRSPNSVWPVPWRGLRSILS